MYSPPSEEAADWKRTNRGMSEKLPSWLEAEDRDDSVVSSGISMFAVRCVCVCVLLWEGLDLGSPTEDH